MGDLFDKAVGFNLKISTYGNRRKVDSNKVETDADRRRINVSKQLLKSPELDLIRKYDGEFKQWLQKRALPSMFRAGIWLIPLDLVPEVDARFESYKAIRASLVMAFVQVYEDCVEKAREDLGSLFNEADYPDASSMSKYFDEQANYVEFKTPKSLGSIRAGMYEKQEARLKQRFDSAFEGIKALMRAECKALLDHAVDRLSPDTDGKKKVLHETVLTNIADFLGTFRSKNICEDGELDAIVSDIKDLNAGLDIKKLRSEESVRDAAKSGFEKLKARMDQLVQDAPMRELGGDD